MVDATSKAIGEAGDFPSARDLLAPVTTSVSEADSSENSRSKEEICESSFLL